MRLLRLEVENLNALYGNHAIDFQRDLQEAPLFLICGPTGAGKSTLLDAIGLALFGVTPRLREEGRREAREDVSPSHALSRGAARGRAVLEFRKSNPFGDPITYQAVWEVWRGNRRNPKAHGALQGPYRWLSQWDEDQSEWNLLATDYASPSQALKTALRDALEGFSFEDFTRCMLLAQGDFAAFLKATEGDRAAILERLTRTERYQRLGALAAGRCRQAKEAHTAAREAVGSVQILDEAACESLRDVRDTAQIAAQAAQAQVGTFQAALAWREQARSLEKALAEAEAGEGEAASAWEATASARLRLEVFEAAKGALERLAQARSARLQPSEREGDLERRSQEAQRRSEALSRVLEAHGLAEQALERAQHASSSKEPEIQRARALRQALTAAEAEAGRAATAVRESESARDGAASAFLQAQTHSEAAERARELADAALAAAPHGALAEGFGALEARQSTHREACAAHGRELRALKQREAGLPALQSTYQAAEAAANSSARICEGLESEAEAATRDLALRLEGAADATTARRELESRREALRSRQSGLQALIQHLASQELARKRAEDLDQAVERVEQELAAAQVELHALDARLKEVADSIAAMEDGLLLARWGQGLAEQRGRLQEGVPCPLCGAEDHPAVRDPEHAKRDEEARQSCARLETHLTDQREAQVELTQQLQRAHREVARLESEQDAARGRQEGVWKEVATATQAIEVAAKALEVPPEAPILDRHLEALALDLGRLEEARCHLDESERAHREAQAEAVQARLAHAEARTSLQAAQQRLEEARTRSEEEGQRLAGVGRELDRQREALMAEFLGLGVQAEHLDEALVEARTRVRAFLAAKAQAETAEREWQVALHDLEVARQAQGAAEAEVEARQAERSRRHEELERAQAAASECLEGADPEPIYRALQEAVKGAQEVVKARVAELREAQQDATRAQAAHEEALRRHHEAIQSAANAETELAEALRPHGDEASLEAKAIPPEEAEALVEQRAHLDRTLVRAQATLEAMRRQWETHWAGQPKEADSSVDTPTIQAQLESLGAEIQEHQRTVAQAAMALEAQEEARRRQRDAVLRLQATEAELNLWDRMNRLLGTNEGEAFRRFAQVLNLRDLLAKANARLERLRPRYRLVPAMGSDGSERLAFAVEDAAHAGEIRPVNTLSGGETFLVSLSLALALADYRTVRMPLETLLLDEGFGTLDPQSLAEVLGTLGSLTAQGTQVGIISHVEALQERIPARIRVQPAGLGRSILKVEV